MLPLRSLPENQSIILRSGHLILSVPNMISALLAICLIPVSITNDQINWDRSVSNDAALETPSFDSTISDEGYNHQGRCKLFRMRVRFFFFFLYVI